MLTIDQIITEIKLGSNMGWKSYIQESYLKTGIYKH